MRMQTERMGTDALFPLLLRLALPSMVGLVIANLYVVIDRIFVGRYVNEMGLAAMNGAMPIWMIIFAVAILIGRGSSVLYSIALGAKRYDEAQRWFGMSMLLFLGTSLFITVFGLLFLEELLHFFGVPEEAFEYGRSYLSISLFGTVFTMLSFQNNLIRAEGYSMLAMATQIVGALLHIFLDWLFMKVFSWGMAGAAWSTLISNAVSAVWVLWFFWSGRSVVGMDWRTFRIDHWRNLWKMCYNGCSPFAINIAGSVIYTVQNRMLLLHGGALAMAAFGAIMTVNMLLLSPIFGICMGMQPLIGYNTGAQKYARVLKAFYDSIWLSAVFTLIPYFLVEIFARPIVGAFCRDNPDLLNLGTYSLRYFLLLMPLGCGTILISQYFQAVGKSPSALLIAMLRQLLFQLPLTLWLPGFLGYNGVLVAGPLGDALALGIGFYLMRREIKMLKKKMARETSPLLVG